MQVDRALQEPPGRSQIALGREQKIHRLAIQIDGAVKVFPLASNVDVSLVHPPASPNGSLAPTQHSCQNRQHLERPTMNRGVDLFSQDHSGLVELPAGQHA